MDDRQQQIKQLQLKLKNLLGRTISKNSDVVELESIINSLLPSEDQISYSTLRRFFGLIPSTAPSPKTLRSLSKILGYRDFSDFCLKNEEQNVWALLKIFNQLEQVGRLEKEQLKAILLHQKQLYYLSHFGYFLSQQLKQHNFKLLKSLFKVVELFPPYYFDRLRIADVLGGAARSMPISIIDKEILPIIYESAIAEELFLYLFVDYSSFNGYYGHLIQKIDISRVEKNDDRLFIQLIRNSITYFKQEPINRLPKLNTKGMHPILKGRYHAQLLLETEEKKTKAKEIFQEARLIDAKQGYFFEILPVFILLKDFDSIAKAEKRYYEALLTPQSWTFEDKKAFSFIAFSLLAIRNEEKNAAKIMLSLIDLDKIFSSYRKYVELLYCIAAYHLALEQDQKNTAESFASNYSNLAKEMAFPFFSDTFLKNYFK